MNLREEILAECSKEQWKKLSDWIGKDEARFADLMDLFFAGEYRVSQRSANVVAYCFDKHAFLLTPYLSKMVDYLENPPHVSVTRNTVRILQNVDLPQELIGKAANLCFDFLAKHETPIAIKAFSMTILANICVQEPDLKNELILLIEEQMPYGSAGFKSRGRKTLEKLRKL
ncbi:MAG: hypothetical protein ACPG4Z_03140 [Chitinophagales bacterium]